MTDEKDTIEYEDESNADITESGDENDEDGARAKVKKLKEDLKACEALQKEYLDGWQRAKADYVNYKKDEGKRYQEMAQAVSEDIIHDILVVLDSFQMARRYDMPKNVADGVFMIAAQLEDVLRKRGLLHIPVRLGEELDPAKHESIGEVESEHLSGTIAEEVQKGYTMNGRVLRPARVKIAK